MYDKKYFRFLVLTISAVLLCISFHLSASALLADPDDTVTIYGRDYNSALDKCNSLSSNGGNIPDGYSLIGVAIYPDYYGVGHNTRADYFYALDFDSWTAYTASSGYLNISKQPNSATMYRITNRFTDDSQVYVDAGNSSGTVVSTANFRFISYIPVYDENGDISRPFVPLVSLDVCGIAQGVHCRVEQSSQWIPDMVHWDLYLYPSDISVTGGTVNRVITSPKYITELSASEVSGLTNSGFGGLLDTLQENYNDFYSGGSWYSRGVPQIHFFAECQDTSLSYRFDPDFYNLPYVKISSGGSNGLALIRREDFFGGSGVYSYEHLALVLVARGDTKDSIIRYDFSRSILNSGSFNISPQLEDKNTYVSGTVSDLQELADYLKQLISTLDENNTINDNNFLTALNTIPWSNFISGGVSAGLDGWTPKLAMELDDIFGNLFDDWTNPSQEELNNLMDDLQDERDNLRSKLAFVYDVKTEVLFVHTSILESGTTPPKFKVPLSAFWSGGSSSSNDAVVIIDFDSIPAIVITSIKNIITVFLSLSVVVYIWRTLPATIGNMPSDK